MTGIPRGYDPTGGDGYIRNEAWTEVENALLDGIITDEEYELLAYETDPSDQDSIREALYALMRNR